MMHRRGFLPLPILWLATLLGGSAWAGLKKSAQQLESAAYADPLPAPPGPLRVFHLGHSLVGRDMPAMLAQMAGAGHRYESQLGWGTPLRAHWEDNVPIKGFDTENDHARFRPAMEAVSSGEYDAVVLTEMVELRDAIRYHQSGKYLSLWADLARNADPGTRVYLYETWHPTDDPDGWLTRLDDDLEKLWEDRLLAVDLRRNGGERPVHVIPAGQVMARFVRKVESADGVDNIGSRHDLFARQENGARDPIHFNDMGAYLVALTHYAVLYHESPVGLPRQLRRADGRAATAPGPEAARLMQETVQEVVTGYAKTGVAA
jgi:hypothetical protein